MPTANVTLDDILERAYGLVAEASPDWAGLLDALARHCGGTCGQLVIGRPPRSVLRAELSGMDPRDFWAMVEQHGESDPRPDALFARMGRVLRDSDLEPPGFDDHPIVRDHLDRLDLRRQMGLAWSHEAERFAVVAVMRSRRAGPFDAAEAKRFGRAGRHVLRAQALRESLARAAAGAVLGGARATVLVDGKGRALFLNAAAEELLRKRVISARGGRLSVGDEAAEGRFAAALALAGAEGEEAPEEAILVLSCADPEVPSGFGRYAAQVFPLPPFHPFRSVAPEAVAGIQVARLDGEGGGPLPLGPGVLAEAFGLTPREARLAGFLATGASLEDASRAFGVSRNTLRAQLQAVFDKTGMRRQAELARLVQRLAALRD